MRTRLSLLLVCAELTACGGRVEPAHSSPDSAAPPSSPADAGAPAVPDANTCAFQCPPTAPVNGGPCERGTQCEYGKGSTTAGMNVTAVCTCFGTWSVSEPATPTNCPGFGSGSPCSAVGASCEYPQGACACSAQDGGSAWKCNAQISPTCPWPRPPLGSSCDPDAGAWCSGPFNASASSYLCVPVKGCGGRWVVEIHSTLPSPC